MQTTTIPFEINYQHIGENFLQEESVAKINLALAEYGAILLRGFPLKTVDDFSQLAKQFIKDFMDYTGGVVVRQPVKDQIYSSTEFPSTLALQIHNEMAYSANFPQRILFFCLQPAKEGGQTPICNCEGVLRRLPTSLVEAIHTHGVCYIQHLPKESDPFLRGWQATFETDNQQIAQEKAEQSGWSCNWNGDFMEMTSILSGIQLHPHTKKEVWFNQITTYHPSTVEYTMQLTPQEYLKETLLNLGMISPNLSPIMALLDVKMILINLERIDSAFKNQFIPQLNNAPIMNSLIRRFPHLQTALKDFNFSAKRGGVHKYCTLGNGTPFTKDDIQAIWSAVAAETFVFQWQQGDVLLLDNLRFAHGRQPFRGQRQILVIFGS